MFRALGKWTLVYFGGVVSSGWCRFKEAWVGNSCQIVTIKLVKDVIPSFLQTFSEKYRFLTKTSHHKFTE